jgi:hypothetical protein
MIGVCCPDCKLRFSRAAVVHYAACPGCGRRPQSIASREQVVGFQLLRLDAPAPTAGAAAIAVSLPSRGPSGRRP